FDGDGHLDLFVPQTDGRCRLFRNNGNGTFTDVSASAGDLTKPIPGAVSAAWGDFDNDGKPDLLVCCLRGPNRYFKNNGNGTFTDKTADLGLNQKVFNSQAAEVDPHAGAEMPCGGGAERAVAKVLEASACDSTSALLGIDGARRHEDIDELLRNERVGVIDVCPRNPNRRPGVTRYSLYPL